MKDFREHFFMLYEKLKAGENFAFSRFSDGELRIMQNKTLILGEDYNKIGHRRRSSHYEPEDRKHFDPKLHPYVHDKLMEAYKYRDYNYYVGLSCRCCVGKNDFRQMLNWYGDDDKFLTWSNLWVNANYPLFVKYMIPEFSNHPIVYILNKRGDLYGLPFTVKKDFRVGDNCIVNDFNKADEVDLWIESNNIKNHVFLFSASSLSNFMIYDLYKCHPNNTYIDIGTTLNPYLGLASTRAYLNGKDTKICTW